MESNGLLVPIWVQAIIIALVVFLLGRYGHLISTKWELHGRNLSTVCIDSCL